MFPRVREVGSGLARESVTLFQGTYVTRYSCSGYCSRSPLPHPLPVFSFSRQCRVRVISVEPSPSLFRTRPRKRASPLQPLSRDAPQFYRTPVLSRMSYIFPNLLKPCRMHLQKPIPKPPVSSSLNRNAPMSNVRSIHCPVAQESIPRHLAVIMDGNARWARARGVPVLAGYEAGVLSLRTLVRCCCAWSVPAVTVFAFSKDNWQRKQQEVNVLLQLMSRVLVSELPLLQEAGIRLHFFGELHKLPDSLQAELEEAMSATEGNTALQLCVALSYSSRQDITKACTQIAELAASDKINPSDITSDTISQYLSTSVLPQNLGEPDLLIRTSGEQRLSDFLLWELAYTEFHFTDVHWPEFGEEELRVAFKEYARRNRRFGTH
mmetsp:Transcript_186/g.357  ORF Transcript_186/g.357 Transcript_186/m.357 type:complete len:379 (+) Transcript_186:187-1323(+)